MKQKQKTVISASRRTDLPAFHYEWLQAALEQGWAEVANPRFRELRYRVDLHPDAVHSLVLWSKDFGNVLARPGYLANYNLYFQYTVNNYSRVLEPGAPPYEQSLQTLAGLLGRYRPEQFNIRFDPVIISVNGETAPTPDNPDQARLAAFERLCRDLAALGMQGCRLTTSYIAVYRRVARKLAAAGVDMRAPDPAGQTLLAGKLAEIAASHGFDLYSCACAAFAAAPSIRPGRCIDGALLQQLFGGKVSLAADSGQRQHCACTRSRDIGSYGQRCGFGCTYCYAAGQ